MAGGGPLLPRREHGPTVPGRSGDAIKHFTRHQFVQIRTEPSICSDSGEECSADGAVQAMPTVCPSWTVKNTFIHVEEERIPS